MLLSTDDLLKAIPKEVSAIQKKSEKERSRQAWLAKRRGRITASAVGKFFTSTLKVADNKTSRQYLFEKISEREGAEIPQKRGPALEWGNEQESYAVISFMNATGLKVTKWGDGDCYDVDGKEYQSDGQEFLMLGDHEGATPDGLILPKASLQVKCPYNPGVHRMYCHVETVADFKKLEPVYYAQMQHEMRVIRGTVGPEVELCYFVSYDPRNKKRPMKVIEIPFDPDFQKLLEDTIAANVEIMEAELID